MQVMNKSLKNIHMACHCKRDCCLCNDVYRQNCNCWQFYGM